MSEREVLVYVDRREGPALAGRLFMRTLRERESASFEYEPTWLERRDSFALDPTYLPLARGAFHTAGSQKLFGGLTDSAPDRWGRNLMARQARLAGVQRTLFESDYLLAVDDVARQGALRFKEVEAGPYLASGQPAIPPLVRLGELLSASDRVLSDEADTDALRLLLAPGSSLGGARPKASVIDADGRLAIAKFPATSDPWPVIVWEQITFELALGAGVVCADTRLTAIGRREVLLAKRFDRRDGERVAYLSAMALMGAADGEEGHSYLELADAIRRHGVRVDESLHQLWRRMVFNVLVSNTDDHLRNHGFLRESTGWVLAPAFDMNPVPVDIRPRVHSLMLDETSADASIERVLAVAAYFGLDDPPARKIAREVARAIADWRSVARTHGLGGAAIERMQSAFDHDDLARALGLDG